MDRIEIGSGIATNKLLASIGDFLGKPVILSVKNVLCGHECTGDKKLVIEVIGDKETT